MKEMIPKEDLSEFLTHLTPEIMEEFVERIEKEQGCESCGKKSVSLKKCSRCKKVKYCSVECQTKDWKSHKIGCKK